MQSARPVARHQGQVLPAGREQLLIAIGDAVVGVNFFSRAGVNSGFQMAQVVAQALCDGRVDQVDQRLAKIMDAAMETSEAALLRYKHTLTQCSKTSVSELRHIARRYRYRGVMSLPKEEMCQSHGRRLGLSDATRAAPQAQVAQRDTKSPNHQCCPWHALLVELPDMHWLFCTVHIFTERHSPHSTSRILEDQG